MEDKEDEHKCNICNKLYSSIKPYGHTTKIYIK